MTSQFPPSGPDLPPLPPPAQQPPMLPPQVQPFGHVPYPGGYPMQYAPGYGGGNGVGVAAGVVGIISAVFFWVPFFGLILGVTGFIMGMVGLQRANRMGGTSKGLSITGIACGSVVILLNLFIIAAVVSHPTVVSGGP